MIKHLRHSEIDKAKWDSDLLRCENRMWYAQSWVLDHTSPGWEALIDDSSSAMMPLTWRRKFLFKYLFQPYGTQQLGVFAPEYSDRTGEAFLRAIPSEFKFCDIALNGSMKAMNIDGAVFTSLDQQVLPLDRPLEQLRKHYSTGHLRNLRKGGSSTPVIDAISAREFREIFVRTTATRFKSGTPADHDVVEKVIEQAIAIGQCKLLGIRSSGVLCAAACFMEWEGRSIFYKSAVDERGLQLMGMFRIVDRYIEMNANKPLLLDFAGSNTPSVARFNSGFGAQGRVYLRLQRNNLPPPFKWFKK